MHCSFDFCSFAKTIVPFFNIRCLPWRFCLYMNAGDLPGAEVPQLYLGFPAEAGEPPRQPVLPLKQKCLVKMPRSD